MPRRQTQIEPPTVKCRTCQIEIVIKPTDTGFIQRQFCSLECERSFNEEREQAQREIERAEQDGVPLGTLSSLEEVTRYQCGDCGETYEDESDAQGCCGSVEEVQAYRCMNCSNLYDDESDALDCCSQSTETQGYLCPACGDFHENEEDAQGCCR